MMRARHVRRLLAEETLDRQLAGDFMRVIGDTADRIAKIVSGLRTFSRSGAQDPLVPSAVRTIVDDSIALCGERFRIDNVELQLGEVEPELAILCRSVEISQVLVNLLNNAYDAVKELAEPRWVRIDASAAGPDAVAITVTDAGRGIPASIREKIFQPFFTTKDVGSGTGLGLSVSLGIVRNHGGELAIDTAAEHTRFVIRLPRAPAQTLAAA
jgi:C4-dicarboxylate-specific signal transduction histidine kinase